nr:hypothetical protein [uncultured Flavobacterium sp.]
MKKLLLVLTIICSFQNIHSQEIYCFTGKNYTNYDYKDATGISNPNLQTGSGNFYEMGYAMPLGNEKISYSIGLNLNEYNAIGGNTVNSYSWNTQYLGVKSSISYSLFDRSSFDVAISGGLTFATLIYGKQEINGTFIDLMSQKEFTGFIVQPFLGFQTRYNILQDGYLSFGYNFSKSFNVTNSTNEKLSFNNSQLQFGIHFNMQ